MASGVQSESIERSIAYIWEHCGQGITLDKISSIANYSKFHFARQFRAETGVSPVRFLFGVRMSKAKVLLRTTTQTVSDIANEIGFCSYGTFTSRFTEAVGLNPSGYRRYASGEDIPLRWSRGEMRTSYDDMRFVVESHDETQSSIRFYLSVFAASNPMASPSAMRASNDGQDLTVAGLRQGRWYVRVVVLEQTRGVRGADPGLDMYVGYREFTVGPGSPLAIPVRVQRNSMRCVPQLLAVPELDRGPVHSAPVFSAQMMRGLRAVAPN